MKFMALLTPTAQRSREEFEPHKVEEEIHLWLSYRDGYLREFYFQPQPTVITLIYEVESAVAVIAELDSLPMVKTGLLDRQVVHLGPWIPLEDIFDKSTRNW